MMNIVDYLLIILYPLFFIVSIRSNVKVRFLWLMFGKELLQKLASVVWFEDSNVSTLYSFRFNQEISDIRH